MSKLSDRFKKIYEQPQIENLPESSELQNNLLEKVNSVPYWNEYAPEEQMNMVKSFVENLQVDDSEPVCESLLPIVTGFGPLQNLLDNEKVSAVFVNDLNSIHIEIGGKVFDTEIKLSENMLQYVLNLTGNRSEAVYTCKVDNYIVDVIKPEVSLSGINISIRKIKDFDVKIPQELSSFLREQIGNKKRIVITGNVNSGKSLLLKQLVRDYLTEKRCYIFEKNGFAGIKSGKFVNLNVSKFDYETLLSIAQKSNPEYIISDLNKVDDIAELSTLRAASLESAFRTLVANYPEMAEKYAKLKVLNDFDYIICVDGLKIVSVAELTPAKTMALSINILFEA